MNAAVDSCYWPLYEVVDGCYRLTYVPERILPVEDWLRPQKRFAHLLRPEARYVLEEIQRQVDREWSSFAGVPARTWRLRQASDGDGDRTADRRQRPRR